MPQNEKKDLKEEPHQMKARTQKAGNCDQMSRLEEERPLSPVPLPCGFTLSSVMWLQGKSEAIDETVVIPDETALSKQHTLRHDSTKLDIWYKKILQIVLLVLLVLIGTNRLVLNVEKHSTATHTGIAIDTTPGLSLLFEEEGGGSRKEEGG